MYINVAQEILLMNFFFAIDLTIDLATKTYL